MTCRLCRQYAEADLCPVCEERGHSRRSFLFLGLGAAVAAVLPAPAIYFDDTSLWSPWSATMRWGTALPPGPWDGFEFSCQTEIARWFAVPPHLVSDVAAPAVVTSSSG